MCFDFSSLCISVATRIGKPNLESGTPGFELFIESASSDQPLDLHVPYLSVSLSPFPPLKGLIIKLFEPALEQKQSSQRQKQKGYFCVCFYPL